MKPSRSIIASVSIFALLALGLPACTSRSRAQNQAARDEETREKVADATAKAKAESQAAAQQIDEAARRAEHEAKVAAEGAQEGWNRDHPAKVDLNSSTETELRGLPGLNENDVQRVVNGRPYKTKEELVTRGILTQGEYDRIQDRLSVNWPPAWKR